jgi:hypothetical protein
MANALQQLPSVRLPKQRQLLVLRQLRGCSDVVAKSELAMKSETRSVIIMKSLLATFPTNIELLCDD